jgi:aspartyl/asparaginyl-tRNA synthetase
MASKIDSDLLRVAQRANIMANIRAFLLREGYIEVDVPELVVSTGACEALDMYSVDTFGDLAFLRQTGQLYLEELVVRGLDKVYCEGQSFRKEPSSGDGRHLCEFRLIEMERKDMELDELVAIEVDSLKYVVKNLDPELFNEQTLERLYNEVNGNLPCVTYREALTILDRLGEHIEFGDDINRGAEQLLIQEFGKGGIAIIKHPTPLKFFNMEVCRDDPTVVNSCDLILRVAGETFGSAVRETDPDNMRQRLHNQPMYGYLLNRAKSFAEECARTYNYSADYARQEAKRIADHIDRSFEDYFALFKDNPIRRAGYGLGIARLFQYILDTEAIDEAVTFPVTRKTFH